MATVVLDGWRVANFIGNFGSLCGGSGDASVGTISVSSVRGSFVPEVVARVAHSYGVVVDCVVVAYGEVGTSLYDSPVVSGISPVENGCRIRELKEMSFPCWTRATSDAQLNSSERGAPRHGLRVGKDYLGE